MNRPVSRSHLLVAAALLAAVSACRAPTSDRAPRESPTTGNESPEGESAESPGAAPSVDGEQSSDALDAASEALRAAVGEPPPASLSAEQVCRVNEDCRVFQPGDWNARVECCYEYGCDLDYVAVNQSTWAELRAWQAANPFDCAEHLQTIGPCSPRNPRCGLVQDPPPPACIDDRCVVAYPLEWPIVDPRSQRCTTTSECTAFRPSARSPVARCCDSGCRDDWRAINEVTVTELADWERQNAAPCEDWLERNECPADTGGCRQAAPPVACRGGECIVERP